MPFAFDLIDVYGTKNKVIGLKIFSKFSSFFCQNLDVANICSENLLITIFEQLLDATIHRELEVVVLLYPILLDFHNCILAYHQNEKSSPKSLTLKFYDELLGEMERSCTTAFRRVN